MRVAIAEDSVLLREGLARLLSDRHHEVPAAVADPATLLAAVDQHRPDLVVVDVRMPPTFTDEGLRAALELRARYPGIGVLVLSQYVVERYATKLLGCDVRGVGYLLKDRVANVGEFLEAVSRVGGGGLASRPRSLASFEDERPVAHSRKNFLYVLKAGPAGGRLRRPSSRRQRRRSLTGQRWRTVLPALP